MFDFRRGYLEHQVESFAALARAKEPRHSLGHPISLDVSLADWQAQLDDYRDDAIRRQSVMADPLPRAY